MGLLKPVEPGGAYLKAGIFGLAGSGKTMTATKLAIGVRRFFDLKGSIAYFDTEKGTPYVSEMVQRETGVPLLAVPSRSLDDLKATVKECVATGASVLIVDSVTHVWEEVKESFLRDLNAARKASYKSPLSDLEFQHWAAIKAEPLWGGWTNALLNSPLHMICCGREGKQYAFEEDENGKKKLVTTGTKMKAEGDFGYEPSLVFSMEAEQVMEDSETSRIDNFALVLKDRFNVINGKRLGPFNDTAPKRVDTFGAFLPHIERLKPKLHYGVDVTRKTATGADAEGNGEWQRERRAREGILEELNGELDKHGLGGTSTEARAKRPALVEECFGTCSKTKLEGMNSNALQIGLDKVRLKLKEAPNAAANG